jgi:hypothetical protein
MFYFYVLYSLKDHKLYKGYSADIGSSSLSTRRVEQPPPKIDARSYLFISKFSTLKKRPWIENDGRNLKTGGPKLKAILQQNGILDAGRGVGGPY